MPPAAQEPFEKGSWGPPKLFNMNTPSSQSPAFDAPRPDLASLTPYALAFDVEEIKRRYGLDRVVLLASNENPLGPSPMAVQAARDLAGSMHRYARGDNKDLVAGVAGRMGVDPGRVLCGNGSDELIDLVVRARVTPGKDTVLAQAPCFDVYRLAAVLAGARFAQVERNPDFSNNFVGLLRAADESTALVFLTNPDNPTGHAIKAGEIMAFARDLPDQALLVVDEAYVDFCDAPDEFSMLPHLEDAPNVCVLRTLSKAYGLAGARLGWGVFPPVMADGMRRAQIPFSVNAFAACAGLAALDDNEHLAATRELTRRGRELLSRELARLGCDAAPSQANFIMFRPPADAGRVFEGLLSQGVLVRGLGSAGLPDRLRVSVGTMEENEIFIQVLEQVLP